MRNCKVSQFPGLCPRSSTIGIFSNFSEVIKHLNTSLLIYCCKNVCPFAMFSSAASPNRVGCWHPESLELGKTQIYQHFPIASHKGSGPLVSGHCLSASFKLGFVHKSHTRTLEGFRGFGHQWKYELYAKNKGKISADITPSHRILSTFFLKPSYSFLFPGQRRCLFHFC